MGECPKSADEIARLFDVARGEDAALHQLDGCVATLHEIQQAKAALKTLSAAELRAALEFRAQLLRGEPA